MFAVAGGELPTWEVGEQEATRKAYGEALTALGAMRGDVVALDGEVSNSTHSELFREAHPDRYFEMFIAEQQMVAAAVGLQVRGWVPYASTFAAFLSRAYDFVRMAAISRASIRLSGSHAGVSIGEDGPSQMALEDIASFRAIHGSTVLHPSDANQTAKLVAALADREGISFLRTLRGKTEVRTPADEDVAIGGSRVVRDGDDVAIVACGITVDQAVEAAERLAGRRHLGARDRRVLDQADRRRDAARGRARVRRDRHRRGPLARGRAGRRGAGGAGRGRGPPAGAQARGARDADVGHARRAAALGRHRRRRDRRRGARARTGEGRIERGGRASPPRRRPAALLAAAPAAASAPDEATKLAKARERWAAQDALDYTYRVRLTCFCPDRDPVTIRVRDGEPRGTPRRLRRFDTIEELFSADRRGARARHRGARRRATRAVTGAPRWFNADPIPQAIDDEYVVTVRKLRITRREP